MQHSYSKLNFCKKLQLYLWTKFLQVKRAKGQGGKKFLQKMLISDVRFDALVDTTDLR